MILSIVQIVFGILFALFIPGFILTLLLFKDRAWIEKIAFSVAFSIIITVFLGIFLGYNKAVKDITGGINVSNVWFWEIVVTIILLAVYLMRKKLI